jgi:hypothetical protein
MKQTQLKQDARTGLLGVTLPSARRPGHDLEIEAESSDQSFDRDDYEYVSTSLITQSTHSLSDIEIGSLSRASMEEIIANSAKTCPAGIKMGYIIDPKTTLAMLSSKGMPYSAYEAVKIRELAFKARDLYLSSRSLSHCDANLSSDSTFS